MSASFDAYQRMQRAIEERLLKTIAPVKYLGAPFLDASKYYYKQETNQIYQLSGFHVGEILTPAPDTDRKLRELYNLPSIQYT